MLLLLSISGITEIIILTVLIFLLYRSYKWFKKNKENSVVKYMTKNRGIIIVIIVIIGIVVGVKLYEKQEKLERERNTIENRLETLKEKLIEKYGKEDAEAIYNGKVKIGWSKEMCRASWGEPYGVTENASKTLDIYLEKWHYSKDNSKYLIFNKEKLESYKY